MSSQTCELGELSWKYRAEPGDIALAECRKLARDLKIPLALATLLRLRGFRTADQANNFLYPNLADLPSPSLMKDMDKAVALVVTAFKEKWPVVIHGDYDVDGKSGTALLSTFMKSLDIDAICYVPDRLTDGYGLGERAVRQLAARVTMPALLITVDCGVTAVDEVKLAKELGFKVLVTDHHEAPPILPDSDALLNPKQAACSFPFSSLAGVGVAFYLIAGIRSYLVQQGFWTKETAPNLKKFLDFVALGTVADVMPLTGVNRILVRAGLEVLTERSRPGIWALCEKSGIPGGLINSDDISFKLAPRLNAAGRLGVPQLALDLLTCNKTDKALELAGKLEKANVRRKALETAALDKAFKQCVEQVELGRKGLVAYGPWHSGVVGIVASRIVDKFHKPAIVFTDDPSGANDDILKGSGRSSDGCNLYELLGQCSDGLIQYGGHEMAAGLTIHKHDLDNFMMLFDNAVSAHWVDRVDDYDVVIDYYMQNGEIFDHSFMTAYQALQPFGEGNPEPIFMADRLRVSNVGVIKNHLKFRTSYDKNSFHTIGFDMGEQAPRAKSPMQLAFKLKKSWFRGRSQWELHAVAIG